LFGRQRKSPSTDFYQYLTIAYLLPWRSVTGDEKLSSVAYPNSAAFAGSTFFFNALADVLFLHL
jgi:hypothetical protein